TGIVEPHQYAGYSGGRKTVAIGCAGEPVITATHGMRFLEDPGVRLAKIEGNPFHETVREIARRAGLRFCLNVVTDDRERILAGGGGRGGASTLCGWRAARRDGRAHAPVVSGHRRRLGGTGGRAPREAPRCRRRRGGSRYRLRAHRSAREGIRLARTSCVAHVASHSIRHRGITRGLLSRRLRPLTRVHTVARARSGAPRYVAYACRHFRRGAT